MPCSRTIVVPRTSYFNPVRLGLKATLVANLLVLGHVLLTTSANAPIPIHLTPYLPKSLSVLSALIFLSLLWISFTLIENCDISSKQCPKEAEKGMVFSRTWIEGVSQLAVLGFWLGYWKDAEVIMGSFSHHLNGEFVLLPLTYFSVQLSLVLLNIHLITSVILYAFRNGLKSLDGEFWCGRTGWWVGQVRIERVVERDVEYGVGEKC
ncbi:uncharacterized protein I303_100826 [Kwoniella dejecticola CBS 10117]|uniref:Transmembrane protein n=1 Tax=Kwoniella dejecticola CBS 10117 TaxID=1296121 RepID=A0A1A6AG47_9TREE|nr:uncharacterized protein I303_00828 [Kwoniella dejecticola CBS 10117]OBR89008.1 hypothetical protein I303_00828 [Kwoniella dejecticola CBS 10117]